MPTGSCQCGAITYRVDGEALMTYACHCSDCQKRTGSACSMGSVFPATALHTSGELSCWQRISDAGVSKSRFSCAACGNVIYGVGSDSVDFVILQPGTLDDTRKVLPEAHIWTRSAQSWHCFPKAVPVYATQPDNMMELLTAALAYRATLQS